MPSSLKSRRPVGLIARLENSRLVLPLKAIEIEAQITGDLVSVELEQLFLQDHAEPLDCTYTFPLPADAAVHRCEMHVGDRVITAKVMERLEAERLFEEKKNEGRRAALATMDRENLFNLDLGNVQPGDLIRMRFAYVQRLDRLDDLRSLQIPLTPSVRYVPGRPLPRANQGTGTVDDTDQVPDASRVSPPRIDALHPDAASFHARVRIDEPRDRLASLRSPSHSIDITEDDQSTVVTISGDDEIPDRDFVTQWAATPSRATSARAWTTNRDGVPYALLELNGGPLPADARPESRDVYVLLDRSGSMRGAPWEAACRAMASFAKALPADTRIDLTLFESAFTHFTPEPVEASTFLEQAGPNASRLIPLGTAGGTELAPALDAVFARRQRFSADEPAVILLITDGMVANEQALRDRARQSDTTLHLVGIGFAPNDSLRSVAEATGGQAVFSPPDRELEQIVSRFSSRLTRPLFEHLTLPDGWASADGVGLPSLYPLEQRLVVLRGQSGSTLGALSARTDWEGDEVELPIESEPIENCALALLWARDRIRCLERSAKFPEALALGREFNLASTQTSFVAWDPEQQVAVASRHLHQPSLGLRGQLFGFAGGDDDETLQFSRGVGGVAKKPTYFEGRVEEVRNLRQILASDSDEELLDGLLDLEGRLDSAPKASEPAGREPIEAEPASVKPTPSSPPSRRTRRERHATARRGWLWRFFANLFRFLARLFRPRRH